MIIGIKPWRCTRQSRPNCLKIKFVSPKRHIMFCLFCSYWWNSYIKDNFFLFFNEFFNITFRDFGKSFWMFFMLGKSIDVKIWQLIEKVTGNCTVFAPRSHFVNEISKEPVARLSVKLSCNWLIMLITMATPISSHVKDKNGIFTARDEEMIF